ncbi:MAG: hypothetical protein EOM66_06070 [Clostridia bacterium]|nr:hypothetical protein [Clostridia bacterium]
MGISVAQPALHELQAHRSRALSAESALLLVKATYYVWQFAKTACFSDFRKKALLCHTARSHWMLSE